MTAYYSKYQIQGRVKTIGASLQHNAAQRRRILAVYGLVVAAPGARLRKYRDQMDPETLRGSGMLTAYARKVIRKASSSINLNTIIAGSEHIPPLPVRKAKPRSASRAARTATADTDSSGGGPDDPDPDPDPQRPYIALGIDHKATTPAGPPVLAVLRPFTDLNTVTARLCRYETRQHHSGPQGPDSTPS